MQTNIRRSRLALISIAVIGALFLAQPAIAQTVTLGSVNTDASGAFSAVVTIPPGTAPGIYDLSATGLGPLVAPYPPTSTGSLSVSSTVVVAGGSLTASGGGFAANTTVVLSLTFVGQADGSTLRIAQANTTRVLTARIKVVAPEKHEGEGTINITNNVSCVSDATATSTASSGEYRIAQTTITNNNIAECRSEAVAHAAKKAVDPVVTPPAAQILVRTGADALPLLAAATATILLGMVLLTAGRRRDNTEPI